MTRAPSPSRRAGVSFTEKLIPIMRAIIISAGQGRRLLPLTSNTPKCLLPVVGTRSLLEVQLEALSACGITDVSVMVGFGADKVEECLQAYTPAGLTSRACYNPFFASSDNLVTVWLARSEMGDDFILLNGDTLFETEVLRRLIASPIAPLTLAINVKGDYDDDDMKVSLNATGHLCAVGKTLDPSIVNGESIGLMYFRNSGVEAFRFALDQAVRNPDNVDSWYLSVINGMTDEMNIATAPIQDLWWGEVDSRDDLSAVRTELERIEKQNGARVRFPRTNEYLPMAEGAGR